MAMTLLESLGFIMNRDKLILNPTREITFLGFTINSVKMTLFLPQDKETNIRSHCHQMLAQTQILGILESARPAIWRAPLHYRMLQVQLTQGLQQNHNSYAKEVVLSAQSRQELHWWFLNTTSCNGSPIVTPSSDFTIYADASKRGWGGVCSNQQANGKRSATEKHLHINILESKCCVGGARLASSTVVASATSITNTATNTPASITTLANRPSGSSNNSPNVSSSTLWRIPYLLQRYQAEGLPTNVAELLIAATRTSTHKHMNPAGNAGAAGVVHGRLILFRHH